MLNLQVFLKLFILSFFFKKQSFENYNRKMTICDNAKLTTLVDK